MSTNTQNMRIAALGPRELLGGLQAFGVDIRHINTKEEAFEQITAIREASKENPYAIIFIIESIVSQMSEDEYESVLGEDLPIILTVPDLTSDKDAGLEKLRSLTKRAVGVDILSGND